MAISHRIREASHAGSWYSADRTQLLRQIENWSAKLTPSPSRFTIGPHAGYRFCGHVLAHSYASLAEYNEKVARIRRVVLMGPSHFKYFKGIQTTNFDALDTPLGTLTVDPLVQEFTAKAGIITLDTTTDLREHCWEMHLPFIAHFLPEATVLPLLFCAGSERSKQLSAEIAPLLADEHTAFIVSSDFCHWGVSFDYVPFAKDSPLIYKNIEKLDREGCKILETGSARSWNKYIDETGNTVCGAKPIGWLLGQVESATPDHPLHFELLAYDQSSKARSISETSVSYASLTCPNH